MKQRLAFCALVLILAAAGAHGEQAAPQPSAYQDVMRAQYAAQGAPLPMRPEEARRIYESYLQSLGQQTKDRPSTDSGDNARIQAH
jgi:hypothetical protein